MIHGDIDRSKGFEFLDMEFERILRGAAVGKQMVDRLVKVHLLDGSESWLLIHIEVQGRREPRFAERMFLYNAAIFMKYRREVVSLVILAESMSKNRSARSRPAPIRRRGEGGLVSRPVWGRVRLPHRKENEDCLSNFCSGSESLIQAGPLRTEAVGLRVGLAVSDREAPRLGSEAGRARIERKSLRPRRAGAPRAAVREERRGSPPTRVKRIEDLGRLRRLVKAIPRVKDLRKLEEILAEVTGAGRD